MSGRFVTSKSSLPILFLALFQVLPLVWLVSPVLGVVLRGFGLLLLEMLTLDDGGGAKRYLLRVSRWPRAVFLEVPGSSRAVASSFFSPPPKSHKPYHILHGEATPYIPYMN